MNFLNGEGNHAKAILRESFDFTVKQGFGESTMIAGAHICLFYVSFFFLIQYLPKQMIIATAVYCIAATT